jgi:2-iminobutanoate/2-iminopropanoate deaminase
MRRVNVDGVERLPAFCHASIAGDLVFVSGTLGIESGAIAVVAGGIGPETTQALNNIRTVLTACGCGLADIAKVNVYLTDMSNFDAMNAAYLAMLGADPPARITVGCSGLALGASIELDCIARLPE